MLSKSSFFKVFIAATILFLPGTSSAAGGGVTPGNSDPGCHFVDTKHYHVDFTGGDPYGLSDSGAVVGQHPSTGTPAFYQAGMWSGGQFFKVGQPVLLRPVDTSKKNPTGFNEDAVARSVNNESRPIVVGYGHTREGSDTVIRAFFWQPSAMRTVAGGSVPESAADPLGRGDLSVDQTVSLGHAIAPYEMGPYPLGYVAPLRNTFALDVSDPIVDRTDGHLIGERIVVGVLTDSSITTPDYFSAPGRPAAARGTSAAFWRLSAGASATAGTQQAVPILVLFGATEARAVNSVGTIAGSIYYGSATGPFVGSPIQAGTSRAFACLYPCNSNANVELLPALPGHDTSWASDITDWGTQAASVKGTGPGEIFGYSANSANNDIQAVVWKKDAAGWSVTALSSAGQTLITTAGSRGVVAGLKDGVPYVFRDGQNPFSLETATKSWDTDGNMSSVSFSYVRAMNSNGDMIAQGTDGHKYLLRPTYYGLIDLPVPTPPSDGTVEHSPKAVAMSKAVSGIAGYKNWVVGYTMRCGGPHVACATIPNTNLYDPAVGDAHAVLWRIDLNGNATAFSLSEQKYSRPMAITPLGDLAGGYAGTSEASAMPTGWFIGVNGVEQESVVPVNGNEVRGKVTALSKDDVSGLYYSALKTSQGGASTQREAYYLVSDGENESNGTFLRASGVSASSVNAVNELTAIGSAVGTMGGVAGYWGNYPAVPTALACTGCGSPTPFGLDLAASASEYPCASIADVDKCEAARSLIVGYGTTNGSKRALVWQKAWQPNGSTFVGVEPIDATFMVDGAAKSSALYRVNGLGQAVGYAESDIKFSYMRPSETTRYTMLSYDQFNQTAAVNQMAFAVPPMSDYLWVAEGHDINESGDIAGWGYKKDGTVGALVLRPPNPSDPACGARVAAVRVSQDPSGSY